MVLVGSSAVVARSQEEQLLADCAPRPTEWRISDAVRSTLFMPRRMAISPLRKERLSSPQRAAMIGGLDTWRHQARKVITVPSQVTMLKSSGAPVIATMAMTMESWLRR